MEIEFLIASIGLIIIAGLTYVSWHLGRAVGFSEARALFEEDPQSMLIEFSPLSAKAKPQMMPIQTNIQTVQSEKRWFSDNVKASPIGKSH